jgi:hypothetical protein
MFSSLSDLKVSAYRLLFIHQFKCKLTELVSDLADISESKKEN